MLGNILAEEYGQMMEMAGENYVLAMTSVADSKEAFEAFYLALEAIDGQLIDLTETADIYNKGTINYARLPERRMNIAEARESNHSEIPLMEAAGRVSGEYVYIYPPGIPVVAPGEVFSKELIRELQNAVEQGMNVKGIGISKENRLMVTVIRENRWLSRRKRFNDR